MQSFPQTNGSQAEDCLNLVVIAPAALPVSGNGLPVVIYMFAGGFEVSLPPKLLLRDLPGLSGKCN